MYEVGLIAKGDRRTPQGTIRRSMEQLEQHVRNPVDVGELAATANVPERTLRTAFTEYFDVEPVRYLRLRQLQLVHHALRAADPEKATVSKILVEHGEWAIHRFASRHRQLFGELPI